MHSGKKHFTSLMHSCAVRPLPEGHMRYARCDAHYLLHLAARLTTELEKAGMRGGRTAELEQTGAHGGTMAELEQTSTRGPTSVVGDISCKGAAGQQTLSPLARVLVASQERTLDLYRKPTSQVLLMTFLTA